MLCKIVNCYDEKALVLKATRSLVINRYGVRSGHSLAVAGPRSRRVADGLAGRIVASRLLDVDGASGRRCIALVSFQIDQSMN